MEFPFVQVGVCIYRCGHQHFTTVMLEPSQNLATNITKAIAKPFLESYQSHTRIIPDPYQHHTNSHTDTIPEPCPHHITARPSTPPQTPNHAQRYALNHPQYITKGFGAWIFSEHRGQDNKEVNIYIGAPPFYSRCAFQHIAWLVVLVGGPWPCLGVQAWQPKTKQELVSQFQIQLATHRHIANKTSVAAAAATTTALHAKRHYNSTNNITHKHTYLNTKPTTPLTPTPTPTALAAARHHQQKRGREEKTRNGGGKKNKKEKGETTQRKETKGNAHGSVACLAPEGPGLYPAGQKNLKYPPMPTIGVLK